jgi:hypothetical protein
MSNEDYGLSCVAFCGIACRSASATSRLVNEAPYHVHLIAEIPPKWYFSRTVASWYRATYFGYEGGRGIDQKLTYFFVKETY